MDLLTSESKDILALQKMADELKTSLEMILQHYRPVMNGEIYLSGEEVCSLLHISKRSLQQYRDDKILPYIQIRGKIIFRQSDLIRILEENYRK